VSIGNLTVGGTGKTPLVALIAKTLLNHGWTPGILTRGYGRKAGKEIVALEPRPGRVAVASACGDEPALLARLLPEVPIVVGVDRYRAGRLAEERFQVNVHLLDDGFQHLALARDLDVILLDTTQELSDHALLPAGRQREPCASLGRADWIVLTRAELNEPGPLEERVRDINPRARIFHGTTKLANLFDARNGAPCAVENILSQPVVAFCGIGNPRAFFADLRRWGFSPVVEKAFPDHHAYSAVELGRLQAHGRKLGATALVTTEKDVMNLPQTWTSEMPVLACAIRAEIVEGGEFDEALLSCLDAFQKAR
jgi:tetraacyldisaccharide 4'-kinase